MSNREKFTQRSIVLNDTTRGIALAAVTNAPPGVEVVIREVVKARTQDQNSLMWSGPLKDIETQAWLGQRRYSDKAWHEIFKIEYLPEIGCEDFARLVKNPDTYEKWATLPRGDRVCIGSTTDLSKYGFGQYLEQVYAFGAGLGVLFSANPNQF